MIRLFSKFDGVVGAKRILFFGIVISFVISALLHLHNNKIVYQNSKHDFQIFTEAISRDFNEYHHSLRSISALLNSTAKIDQNSFASFANIHIDDHSSGAFLGYAYAVANLQTHGSSPANDGDLIAKFVFNPSGTNGISPGHNFSKNPETLPLIQEQLNGRDFAIGYLTEGRLGDGKTGAKMILGMRTRVSQTNNEIIFMGVDLKKAVANVQHKTGFKGQFSLSLENENGSIIYTSEKYNTIEIDAPPMVNKVSIGNEKIIITLKSCDNKSYLSSTEYYAPYVIFLIGLIVSVLWANFFARIKLNERYFRIKSNELSRKYKRGKDNLLSTNNDLTTSNHALETALKTQKTLNASLERFAAVSAHDLNAPLKRINAMVGIVLSNSKESLNSNDAEILERVQRSVVSLNNMVASILDFSKSGYDVEKEECIDLKKVVNEVIEVMSIPDIENIVSIEMDENCIFRGIPSLISQLTKNLISNGIKFNDSEVKSVHITVNQLPDGICRICFTDNGIGVPEEFSENIFEMFTRLHNQSEYQGHGIGLATCHKIATDHGGEIYVDKTYKSGTRIVIDLPCKAPQPSIVHSNLVPTI